MSDEPLPDDGGESSVFVEDLQLDSIQIIEQINNGVCVFNNFINARSMPKIKRGGEKAKFIIFCNKLINKIEEFSRNKDNEGDVNFSVILDTLGKIILLLEGMRGEFEIGRKRVDQENIDILNSSILILKELKAKYSAKTVKEDVQFYSNIVSWADSLPRKKRQ